MNYLERVAPHLEEGHVVQKVHPTYPELSLFNYAAICQMKKVWDEVTLNSRGRVINTETGEVVANPFPKFFNLDEYISMGGVLPSYKPIVFDKLDGSLGIVFYYKGKWHVCTRGSFTSDQAIWAQQWLDTYVALYSLQTDMTYLFEIVYPENRIVLSYDFSGLVLLGAIETKTGVDYTTTIPVPTLITDPPGYGRFQLETVRTAQSYDFVSVEELLSRDGSNREGYVLYYNLGHPYLRVKVKFEEYVRLHKVMTGLSVLGIWELLSAGTDLAVYLEGVPDEFYKWFDGIRKDLESKYAEIYTQVTADFATLTLPEELNRETRGIVAREITKKQYPALLFGLLDGKDISEGIWKLLRPKQEKKDEKTLSE